jgi:hypothetical protein
VGKIDPHGRGELHQDGYVAGVMTLDTNSAIVINTDGTVTLSRDACRQRQGDQVHRPASLVRHAGGG